MFALKNYSSSCLKSNIWKLWFEDDPVPLVSQNYRGELLNVGGRTEPNHLKKICSSNWIRGEHIKTKLKPPTNHQLFVRCFCPKITRQRITTLVNFQGSWGCTAASWGDILGPTARSSICDWRSFSCLKAWMCLDGWVDRCGWFYCVFLGWEWCLFIFLFAGGW